MAVVGMQGDTPVVELNESLELAMRCVWGRALESPQLARFERIATELVETGNQLGDIMSRQDLVRHSLHLAGASWAASRIGPGIVEEIKGRIVFHCNRPVDAPSSQRLIIPVTNEGREYHPV